MGGSIVVLDGSVLVVGSSAVFYEVLGGSMVVLAVWGGSVLVLGGSRSDMDNLLLTLHIFPPMRWLTKTLYPAAAAPAPLCLSTLHCGSTTL